jgi:hypothetical protein
MSSDNIPMDVSADTEISPLHFHFCLSAKFDPLPYTVYFCIKLYFNLNYTVKLSTYAYNVFSSILCIVFILGFPL